MNRLSRRDVFKFLTAIPATSLIPGTLVAKPPELTELPKLTGKPYGTDPNLTKSYKPGDLWPLTFNDQQKKTATAFADLLLPADDLGPAASELRVPDYIDEWISSPYEQTQATRKPILEGLAWLDQEAKKRFQKSFADLSLDQQKTIIDDICDGTKATSKEGHHFFQTFRNLAMGAYYGTQAGWKAIGYVGNIPTLTFDGPPPEVLEQLGLEQTVKD